MCGVITVAMVMLFGHYGIIFMSVASLDFQVILVGKFASIFMIRREFFLKNRYVNHQPDLNLNSSEIKLFPSQITYEIR